MEFEVRVEEIYLNLFLLIIHSKDVSRIPEMLWLIGTLNIICKGVYI